MNPRQQEAQLRKAPNSRKKTFTPEQVSRIRSARADGLSWELIGSRFGVGPRIVRELAVEEGV